MSKEGVRLDYPIPVGDARKGEYARNGILLRGKGIYGYTRIESPFELSVGDFASLSIENLYELIPHVQGTKYKQISDMAERAQILVSQAKTVHLDGFPLPSHEKPFTWELRDKLPDQINDQLRLLKKFGITEVKIGLEMEFSMQEKAISGFNRWRTVKKSVLSGLRKQIKEEAGPVKKKRLQEKFDEIKSFNAREMLMYDLIELNPSTRDILEPLFGANRDGNGYYDGRGVLELKLKPVSPGESVVNRRVALNALVGKAVEYGLELTTMPCFHVNGSLWNKYGNIFNDKNPSFQRKGKMAVEGIAKAFYDSVPILVNKYELESGNLSKLALNVNRQNMLRYSSNRIEVRPAVREYLQDPDMMVAVFLSGAIYGLSNPASPDIVRARKVRSPVVHHTKSRSKVTSHVINNATIREDGTLEVSNEYIREHDDTLDYELGLAKAPMDMGAQTWIFKAFFRSDFYEVTKKFFNSVKVEKDSKGKLRLKFPETSKGKYKFYLPPINMHKIPPEMRKRVIKGEKISNDEYSKYIMPGERLPRPGKFMEIDTERLAKTIEIVGIKSKFIVEEYDLNKGRNKNKPQNFTKAAWARYQRLFYSRSLAHSMTPEFKKEFKKLAKKYVRKERNKRSPELTFKDTRDMFFHKIKDKDYVYKIVSKREMGGWMYEKQVEGVDYFRHAIQIKFEDIRDPGKFTSRINRVLKQIAGKRSKRKYGFIVNGVSYRNGGSRIEIEVTPALFKLLKKIV